MSFRYKIAIGIISTLSILLLSFLIIFTIEIFKENTETIKCHNIDTNFNNGKTKVNFSGTDYVKLINDKLVDKSISGVSFGKNKISHIYSALSIVLFWFLIIGLLIYKGKKIFKNKISIGIFSTLFLFYVPYFVIITIKIFKKETLKLICPKLDLDTTETLDGVKITKLINDEDVSKTKTLTTTPFETSELGFIRVFTIILWIILIPLIIVLIKM
jgi:hypothetical protein